MLLIEDGKLSHETQIRVRYKDTDQMGYSYYGNYPTYYEIGRTEFLRELGFSYKLFEEKGFMMPISKMEIQYLKPAKYDDLLTIKTTYKRLHSIKAEFEYEIFNQNNELLNKGYTLLVFVDKTTRKPKQGPQYFMDKLSEYLKPKINT